MPFVPDIDPPTLVGVMQRRPELAAPLQEYTEILMRGPSSLSAGDRELIAAYVSGVNACRYCHGIHAATAAQLGMDEAVFDAGVADPDRLPVADALKPILRYVAKLTETPSRMVQADADAVFAAGWNEEAFETAVAICALFNFYNRVVEGHGIEADPTCWHEAGQRLSDPERSYGALGRRMRELADGDG